LWNVGRDDGGVGNLRSVGVNVADAIVDVAIVVVVVGIVVDVNDVVIVVVIDGVIEVNDVVIVVVVGSVGVGVGVVVVLNGDGVLCVNARGWCDARCIGKEQMEAAGMRSVSRNKVSCAVSHMKAAVTARTGELHRVIVGFEREGKGICMMHVSGEGVKPAYHPSAKGEGVVNPVFRIFVFVFALNRCTP
jgi:hypothetical protein